LDGAAVLMVAVIRLARSTRPPAHDAGVAGKTLSGARQSRPGTSQ
jgi:hypothetical protein